MRRACFLLIAVVSLSAIVAAAARPTPATPVARAAVAASCSKDNLRLVNDGQLTIGTDNPAYPPWFGGGSPKGSPWKLNDPATGKGFESAVAYAVAKRLGFSRSQVRWVYTPFNRAFAPGPKSFDFDINQISYEPARARQVAFSKSYYDVNQAIVVLKGTPISKIRSRAGLRRFKLGAQLGTTSYGYIVKSIRPSSSTAVFPRNDAAVQALKNRQIDGLVVDLPTAFYVTAVQVPNSKILGQFPTVPGGEHFGMVFGKGNPLVGCVNNVLTRLRAGGTLRQIRQRWLAKATGAPILK